MAAEGILAEDGVCHSTLSSTVAVAEDARSGDLTTDGGGGGGGQRRHEVVTGVEAAKEDG